MGVEVTKIDQVNALRVGKKAPRKFHKVQVCACWQQAYTAISSADTVMVSVSHRALLDNFWWGVIRRGRLAYAKSSTAGKWLGIRPILHAAITGFKQTDHKDRNGLNNMDDNLREASQSQNQQNRKRTGDKILPKGVSLDNREFLPRRFKVTIVVNKVAIFLGRFTTIEEASEAYNAAAHKYFGEFARADYP